MLERSALRLAFVGCALLPAWVPGRAGYVIALAIVGAAQFAASLSGALRELAVTESLYRGIASSLADASAMVPLPLPEAEPELALGRALWAEVRLRSSVAPTVKGEALALALAVLGIALSPFRLGLVPLAAGALVAIAAYLPLHRASARREALLQRALLALHAHIVAFLSARQERIAQGGAAPFLRAVDASAHAHRRATLQSAAVRGFVRRAPLVLALVCVLALADALHLFDARALGATDGLGAAPVLVAIAIAQGGAALFAAIAEQTQLVPAAEPLRALLALPRAKTGGDGVPGACEMIEGKAVRFSYDSARDVIADLSFTVERGRPLILRGENGSGKSTILRLVCGLAAPTAGKIALDAADLRTLSADALHARVAFVPQGTPFDPSATVKDTMLAIDPSLSEEALRDALRELGFEEASELLARPMGALSSGQRRRVQVARAFALDRPILLLDEPEAGLDAASQRRVKDLVARAAKERLVVIATHSELFDEGVRLAAPTHAAPDALRDTRSGDALPDPRRGT